MGHTLLCVLGLFLLNTLLYGHAEESEAILEVPHFTMFEGDSVTLRCRHRTPGNEMKASFIKDGSPLKMETNHPSLSLVEMTINPVSVSDGGTYKCKFDDGAESEERELKVEVRNRVDVILQPNWPQIFRGETITLSCEIQDVGDTEWEYEWRTPSSETPPQHKEYRISRATESHSGDYSCKGRRDYLLTQWSDVITLTVSADRPKPTLTADKTIIPVRGAVTLSCSVEGSADWKYYWFSRTSRSSGAQRLRDGGADKAIRVSQGGLYHCRGGRGDPETFTRDSDTVTIQKTVSNRAVVTLQPNWLQIFSGEKFTVRCDIKGGGDTKWTYEWTPAKLNRPPTDNEYRISRATESHSGDYSCKGRRDSYSSTEWSDVITLTVSSQSPKAELSADRRDFPAGGSVTLSCSVNLSSGWKYFWYRGEKTSELPNTQDAVFISDGQISVSQGGLYWCRGGRGDPVYYTEDSDAVSINKIIPNRAVVTLQPNWSEIYSGETITLRCEIKEGGDTEWEYEWETTSSYKPLKDSEYRIRSAYSSHSGDYRCKGRMKSAQQSSTDWSDPVKLTVSYNRPQPVLTVSPSWLSPGASVTLSCRVKDPSAGWRFFWFKAVPKLSANSYDQELLPGSSNGTEQDSYIVHGQTHTAGYKCRAGRGDPVYYTSYSEPKFVWSADFHSSASLTVSPDRVQHFTSDSVSLSCEGNSTEWRVRRFTKDRYPSYSSFRSYWGTMTGSTCSINSYQQSDAVYWCESGSGEFSNTVNITKQNEHIILVSPVRPVTEGDPVSLSCKFRTEKLVSDVFFYRNDKLIQNDSRRELNISAVLKSDEGFYKCQHSGEESAQSWMSVKVSRPESSSVPVPLIVGLVCGIVLILLLLLLYRYRPSKDSCSIRPIQSESTNRGSAENYSSPVHVSAGDAPLYETIKGFENTQSVADESQDLTYSLIELKNVRKKKKRHEPDEVCVYSEVNAGTADDSLMYAQFNRRNKGKAKKNKGKSPPAAADETVYSEVKPGTALGL